MGLHEVGLIEADVRLHGLPALCPLFALWFLWAGRSREDSNGGVGWLRCPPVSQL